MVSLNIVQYRNSFIIPTSFLVSLNIAYSPKISERLSTSGVPAAGSSADKQVVKQKMTKKTHLTCIFTVEEQSQRIKSTL